MRATPPEHKKDMDFMGTKSSLLHGMIPDRLINVSWALLLEAADSRLLTVKPTHCVGSLLKTRFNVHLFISSMYFTISMARSRSTAIFAHGWLSYSNYSRRVTSSVFVKLNSSSQADSAGSPHPCNYRNSVKGDRTTFCSTLTASVVQSNGLLSQRTGQGKCR